MADSITDEKPKTPPKKRTSKDKISKKNPLQSFFENVMAEFRKVVWPSRAELIKQTVVVVIISLVMGILIFIMDAAFGSLSAFVSGLVS